MDIVLAALKLAPLVIQAGQDFAAFVARVEAAASRTDGPTNADWDALHALEAELRARLG